MTKFRKMFYDIKNNRDCKTIGENKEGGASENTSRRKRVQCKQGLSELLTFII